jgi:ABC-2 type transport system permease protein
MIFFLVIPPITLVLISVTIEREQKTLETVLLQPIDRKQFISGKIVYGAIIVLINTILTISSIVVLLMSFLLIIPENVRQEIGSTINAIIASLLASELIFWIFILYVLVGLIGISLLLVTIAVFLSIMARDEREANMVISTIIVVPLISIIFLVYLPLGSLPDIMLIIIGIIPAIGYLFSIFLILLKGEIIFPAVLSLLAQLLWIGLIIWLAGRLIESEGILRISFKKLLKFWKK